MGDIVLLKLGKENCKLGNFAEQMKNIIQINAFTNFLLILTLRNLDIAPKSEATLLFTRSHSSYQIC